MIPPINGKLVRTWREGLLFTLTPDAEGTIEFRTLGRSPKRWSVTLPEVYQQLTEQDAPVDVVVPAGGIAKKLLRGSKCCDTLSLIDLEHELSIAHPDDTPDHAKFLKYVWSIMSARAARKEEQ